MNERKREGSDEMLLLNLMDCETVPASYCGDKNKDSIDNAKKYLKLYKEGLCNGFVPVLVDRNIQHNIFSERFGLKDTKEDYPKVTRRLIDLVNDNCSEVWIGRIIYNYYLDGNEYGDDVKNDLNFLNPPSTSEYESLFIKPFKEQPLIFGEDGYRYRPYNFSYEDAVFALIATAIPWEVMAWIPMGGFNWCPDAIHQVALAKYLYEEFGAIPMSVSSSTIEYYVPKPLTDRELIEKAAKVLIAADRDVYEDYEVAVKNIAGMSNWFLWWD